MFGKKKPPPPPEQLMKTLARRGPYKVLRGDLGIIGLPGQLFAPQSGTDLPAVAFGHGWFVDSARYRDLLFHLASWGIVAAAPDGEAGLIPSDLALATDLRAALTAVSTVRLGVDGASVTVSPERLGVAGHGFGSAAAVYAASGRVLHGRPRVPVRALACLFPAPTTADLLPSAESVESPALVIAAGTQLDSMTSNALELSNRLGGDVALRTLAGATNRGLIEQRSLKSFIGVNGADKATHAASRAALTGFLLHRLGGDDTYAAFSDPHADTGALSAVDLDDTGRADADHFSQLFGVAPYKEEKKSKGGKAKNGESNGADSATRVAVARRVS